MFKPLRKMLNNEGFRVLLLFALVFGLRLALFINTDNGIDAEAPGRVFQSMWWLDNKNCLPGHLNFGPLDFWLIAGALSLWHNIFQAPRLVSLIFGSLTIIPFYFFSRYCFNKKLAFISGILFSVYILHMKHSVISTAMASFDFFIFSSLFFLASFIYGPGGKRGTALVFLSAVFLNLAGMVRFEGWIFVPLYSVFIFIRGKRLASVLFFFVSSVFPAYFMWISYYTRQDPVMFFNTTSTQAFTTIINAFSSRVFLLPLTLVKTLSLPLVALACFGMGHYILCRKPEDGKAAPADGLSPRGSKGAELPLLSFAVLFAAFWALGIKGNVDFQVARYTITLGLFLIPFSAFGADSLIEKFLKFTRQTSSAAARYICWAVFLSAVVLLQYWGMRQEIKELRVPGFIKSAAFWLKDNAASENDRIALDYDWGWNQNIILYSGLPLRQFGWEERSYYIMSAHGLKVEEGFFREEIRSGMLKYIVVFWGGEVKEGGLFRHFLGLNQDVEEKEIFGRVLKRRYQAKDLYAVYEVLPVSAPD